MADLEKRTKKDVTPKILIDLIAPGIQSWMQITTFKFKKGKKIGDIEQLQTRTFEKTSSFIILALPNDIQIQQPIGWENTKLGIASQIDLNAAATDKTIFDGNLGSIADIAINSASQLSGEITENAISATIRSLSGFTGLNLTGRIAKETRQLRNPRLEVLFNDVQFRTFTFSWKMQPRSKKEAKTIKRIVDHFRYESAPDVIGGEGKKENERIGGKFLLFPSQFKIDFKYKTGKDHPSLPKIGNVICSNVSVNYTSAGKWAEFNDGQPVETELSLTFTETEIPSKDKMRRVEKYEP